MAFTTSQCMAGRGKGWHGVAWKRFGTVMGMAWHGVTNYVSIQIVLPGAGGGQTCRRAAGWCTAAPARC